MQDQGQRREAEGQLDPTRKEVTSIVVAMMKTYSEPTEQAVFDNLMALMIVCRFMGMRADGDFRDIFEKGWPIAEQYGTVIEEALEKGQIQLADGS